MAMRHCFTINFENLRSNALTVRWRWRWRILLPGSRFLPGRRTRRSPDSKVKVEDSVARLPVLARWKNEEEP
jgi:hypothetical protein